MSNVKKCGHSIWQHEDAWMDGLCALCLRSENLQLIDEQNVLRAELAALRKPIVTSIWDAQPEGQ
jgi:hypothetical protein